MLAIPEWATAHGDALFEAKIRTTAADFVVTEKCDIDFSGEGEHDFLRIEKTGNNTHWIAERLAKHGGVPLRDVGYAGLKDRHAITQQWFSVRRLGTVDWTEFHETGVEILEQRRHRRKLRRGAHAANAFRIALRAGDLDKHRVGIAERLSRLTDEGVPNYFGEQRFGRNGSNIDLCKRVFAGQKMSRAKRSIALSAARSLIFNSILARRVASGSWDEILPGELANLDGSGSIFAVDEVTETICARCDEHDIHPTGSLWGDGSPRSTLDVAALENRVAGEFAEVRDGIVATRMDPASRALRLRVTDLKWDLQPGVLWLEFELSKGGYATAVLRELAKIDVA